jgi:large subunit ribosomal protein L18e
MRLNLQKENAELVSLLMELKQASKANEAAVWSAVAEKLARPRHRARPLNVGHLDRLAAADDVVVVPGKVLASGRLTKSITIGAYQYSTEARSKIENAGGKALTIPELLKAHPDGAGVRLLA